MPTQGRPETRGRTLVPPLAVDAAAALVRPPRIPDDVVPRVALAQSAARSATPVLLAMRAAGGRLGVARALHTLGGRDGPLVAVTGRRPSLVGFPPGATLYLDAGVLAPEAALALEALLDDGLVWVLAGLEPGMALPAAVAARFDAVALAVPPLAARLGELPALADEILARLGTRHGAGAPRLAPAALARMTAHSWPHDVAELEATLARGLLAGNGKVVEAEDLALAAEPLPPPAAAGVPLLANGHAAELEFLLAELAHELRNPLVTVKTFAQHLPALLEDAELRDRFATLTGEAIDRIDGLLENVLAFARLGVPEPRPVEVATLLDGVIAEMQPELGERAVRVRHAALPAARCAADPSHLAYALRNLFAGVVREVPPREELVLDATANGVVTLRFAAGDAAAERLRRLVAADGAADEASTLGDPTLLPLVFRLARAVLERNGGGLAVIPEGHTSATLMVRLPTAGPDEGQ
jgi:signal transduction histidine kinase